MPLYDGCEAIKIGKRHVLRYDALKPTAKNFVLLTCSAGVVPPGKQTRLTCLPYSAA